MPSLFAAAPALVPCPSASPCLLLPSRQLLPFSRQLLLLPAIVVATAATDGGGRARQIVAVRRRPRRPVNLRSPAPPQSLSPPSHLCRRHCRQSCAFWAKYLFTYRGISSPVSKKQKSVTAQLLRKLGLFQVFQQV
jgi:hypothetical protein